MTETKPKLTKAQISALGEELDALRQRVLDDLGEQDVAYIRSLIRTQRTMELAGRGLLFASVLPPAWLAGTAALSLSKILDNMEIGHNVMHGQYDWTGDPALSSKEFEWDTACPSDQWRHSHNYMHHTFTNIVGKDRDIGYGVLRMTEQEPWEPRWLGNPVYALLLALFFQYGVALHDLEVERLDRAEPKDSGRSRERLLAGIWRKVRGQTLKDYVLFPLLSGPQAPLVFAGNLTANLLRNVWAFTIIFCGHFPEGTAEFTRDETARETRGDWYLRQMLGSANLQGGPLFHILSGNLGYQIEHHLYPDIPARRYGEIAQEVQDICERYGLPYNTGPLHSQFASVLAKIFRLALPDGSSSASDGAASSGGADPRPGAGASLPERSESSNGRRSSSARPRRKAARAPTPASTGGQRQGAAEPKRTAAAGGRKAKATRAAAARSR